MSLFVLGTIGCAFSPTMGVMIGSRIVAGSGGGGLFTVSSIIIADLVSLADRGLYQGPQLSPFSAFFLSLCPTAQTSLCLCV
jgi:MFS family permease